MDDSTFPVPLVVHYLSIIVKCPMMMKTTPTLFTHVPHSPTPPLHSRSPFSFFLSTVLAQHQTTLSSAARSITMPCAGQLCHHRQWFDFCHHRRIKCNPAAASCFPFLKDSFPCDAYIYVLLLNIIRGVCLHLPYCSKCHASILI